MKKVIFEKWEIEELKKMCKATAIDAVDEMLIGHEFGLDHRENDNAAIREIRRFDCALALYGKLHEIGKKLDRDDDDLDE